MKRILIGMVVSSLMILISNPSIGFGKYPSSNVGATVEVTFTGGTKNLQRFDNRILVLHRKPEEGLTSIEKVQVPYQKLQNQSQPVEFYIEGQPRESFFIQTELPFSQIAGVCKLQRELRIPYPRNTAKPQTFHISFDLSKCSGKSTPTENTGNE